LSSFKGHFYQEDEPFLDSIKQLLVIVNGAESIDLTKLKTINSLLDGWKLLSRFGTIPALPQVKVEVKTITTKKSAMEVFRTDFGQLDQLLSQRKWKEADEKTADIMLKISNRESQGWLNSDDCKNFPPDELKVIDQLWVKHSNGNFGFSVQKDILTSAKIGGEIGTKNDLDTWCKFGEEVAWKDKGSGLCDWKEYDELFCDTKSSKKGHLPVGGKALWFAQHTDSKDELQAENGWVLAAMVTVAGYLVWRHTWGYSRYGILFSLL
jgi:hypothetical protein